MNLGVLLTGGGLPAANASGTATGAGHGDGAEAPEGLFAALLAEPDTTVPHWQSAWLPVSGGALAAPGNDAEAALEAEAELELAPEAEAEAARHGLERRLAAALDRAGADGSPGPQARAAANASAAPVPAGNPADVAPAEDTDTRLPARTLALVEDARQHGLSLQATPRDAARALQHAAPMPEPGALTQVTAQSTPPPAALPREVVPGHLNLPAQRSPDGNETAEQLNARLNWMASHQVGRAQIRVSPPQLGTVEIDIQVRDGKVRADFGASHAEVRAAIEASLPRLRELFAGQGLQLTQTEVSSQLGSQTGADAQARHGGDGRATGGGPARDSDATGEPGDGEPAVPQQPVLRGSGLLDEYA